MANKKISQLTAKGTALAATDLLEISESDGAGGYVTKSVTGANILASKQDTLVSGTNIKTINGNLSVSGNATLSGNISGDKLFNGTSSIEIQTPGGNSNISIGGVSNVAIFTTTGMTVAGNINAGNLALTDFEATRKTLKTEEYLDLCNNCYATIRDDVITLDRSDLEEEDCRQDDDDYSDRCVDHSLDVDI